MLLTYRTNIDFYRFYNLNFDLQILWKDFYINLDTHEAEVPSPADPVQNMDNAES